MKRLHISYPFIMFTSALLVLDADGWFLLSWCAVVAHELGHLLGIWVAGCGVESIDVRLTGLKIAYSSHQVISYGRDAFLAAAGPLTNMMCAMVLSLLSRFFQTPHMYFLIGANIVIGLFNMLPAMPMDGARILHAVLCGSLGEPRASDITAISTAVTGIVMAVAGVYVVTVSRGNFTLLLTAAAVLLGLLSKRLYTKRHPSYT